MSHEENCGCWKCESAALSDENVSEQDVSEQDVSEQNDFYEPCKIGCICDNCRIFARKCNFKVPFLEEHLSRYMDSSMYRNSYHPWNSPDFDDSINNWKKICTFAMTRFHVHNFGYNYFLRKLEHKIKNDNFVTRFNLVDIYEKQIVDIHDSIICHAVDIFANKTENVELDEMCLDTLLVC